MRKSLGDEDVETDAALKHIRCDLQELKSEVSQLGQRQGEQLSRIESGVQQNEQLLGQLAKRVDRALQPRWRSIIFFTAACVITTIVVMLMLF